MIKIDKIGWVSVSIPGCEVQCSKTTLNNQGDREIVSENNLLYATKKK